MDLISVIVLVLILCLVYWAVHRLAAVFGLAPQIVVVIDVALVVLFVLYLLRALGLWSGSLGRLG